MAIIVRFVSDDWHIQQRLIRMQLLAKSLYCEEIARELVSVLQVHYKVKVSVLINAMPDQASVNSKAKRTVHIIPRSWTWVFLSHSRPRA